MTKAEMVVKAAISKMFRSKEQMESGEKLAIRLETIDPDYQGFEIDLGYWDYGDECYFLVCWLYIRDRNHLVPLCGMTNIGYTAKETIKEMAKVLDRAKINYT